MGWKPEVVEKIGAKAMSALAPMRQTALRLFAWAVVVAIILALLGLLYLIYNGYCWKTKSFMTDDEKIEAAIRSAMASANSVIIGSDKTPVPYKDIEDFRRANPDCCQIRGADSEGYPPLGFFARITGAVHDWVRVAYAKRYAYPDGRREDKNVANLIFLNACGVDVTD